MVMTWDMPALESMEASSLAVMQPLFLILLCLEYGRNGITPEGNVGVKGHMHTTVLKCKML